MRLNKYFMFVNLILVSFASLHGCKFTKTKIKAVESDDFFKTGKDRFYLAYVKSNASLTLDGPKVGQELVVGIGCAGESSNKAQIIDVPTDKCGIKTQKLALNERTMLHQFNVVDQFKKPGDCMILLGKPKFAAQFSANPNQFVTGPRNEAIRAAVAAVSWCGLSVGPFLFSGPLGDIANKELSYADAVSLGQSSLGQVLNSIQGAKIVSTSASGLKNNASWAQGGVPDNADAAARIGKIIVPCRLKYMAPWGQIGDAQRNKNKKVFFDSINSADELARKELAKVPEENKLFFDAQARFDSRTAMAIFNPYMVKAYNKSVSGSFENGWGFTGGQKFFDLVKQIQLDLDNGGNAP